MKAGAGAKAGAVATAADPQLDGPADVRAAGAADEPQLGELDGAGDEPQLGDLDGAGDEPQLGDPDGAGEGENVLGPDGAGADENVAGSDAIARGLANGMTLLGAAVGAAAAGVTDTEVAAADSGTRCGVCERDPVGGGADSRGFGVGVGVGVFGEIAFETRVSTEVASPTSCALGIRGISVMAGRDFRYDIHRATGARRPPPCTWCSYLTRYTCARFTLGTTPNDRGDVSSPDAIENGSRARATGSNELTATSNARGTTLAVVLDAHS